MTIASIIKAGITAGKTTEDILKDVYREFPQANTKATSVAWYRAQMKKPAGSATAAPKKTKTAEAAKKAAGSEPDRKAMWEDFKRAAGVVDEGPSPSPSPVYEVRGVKTTQGQEGPGFIATLYCNGKKVAEAHDYGDGGSVWWHWVDDAQPCVEVTFKDIVGKMVTKKATLEEKRFIDFTQALPEKVHSWDETKTPRSVDGDCYIEELVNDYLLAKQLKKLCKKIAYITGDGKLFTVSAAPTAENIAKLVTAHNALVLNTLDKKEALEELRKLQRV